MPAPVSCCIICKNEPYLETCLQNIRPYVQELVVVDTGSTDGTTQQIAQKYADIFEVYTAANNPETGLIEDFAQARQRSFDLATLPIILWCDGDDLVEGLENLPKIIEEYNSNPHGLDGASYIFPYEYSYNERHQCELKHYRERLFFNPSSCFHWVNPVHEVVVPHPHAKVAMITRENIIWKHQRQYSTKVMESGRNLRILRKYYEKVGDTDARQLYYLGLECSNVGSFQEAIDFLIKYIGLSGWEDERVMACLKLVEIYQGLNQLEEGLRWAFKAVEIKENWSEGYWAASKMFFFQAQQGKGDVRRNWERCVHFAREGFKLPPTNTMLFINPLERELHMHVFLNQALNELRDVSGALESCKSGLEKHPHDPTLNHNRKLYEDFLARNQVVENINILKANGTLQQEQVDQIQGLINGQPIVATKQLSVAGYPDYCKTSNYPKDITIEQFPVAQITPHSQAWGIPESYEIDDLPLRMTDQQLQSLVITIWRQYLLHDEVLSAISFLEKAPYNVRDTSCTNQLLHLTKIMSGWLQDKKLMQKHNQPTNIDIEIDVPMPNSLGNNQSGGRFKLVVDHLPDYKVSMVDFGCADGCFANRYGLLGHEVYGLDVVETFINLAKRKAVEFNTGVKYINTYFQDAVNKVPNNYFDYATSTDTYEHLSDPVNDMLIPAKKMLNKNGKFLMTTPYGSWMRGNFISWAHPWVQSQEGYSWIDPRPHGHLIAPSTKSVINHFQEAKYYVKNCYPVMCEKQDVINQGNIFVEAYIQFPKNYPGLDIVFMIGDGLEHWNPETIKKVGQGGSEIIAAELTKRLAALGHRVRVFNSCGEHGEGIYDGVEYYHTNKYQDVVNCDVVIVSRRADTLGNIQAKLKLLWVHDVCAINASNELLLKYDRILALSGWHKNNMVNVHNIHPEQIIQTRNGIDLGRFANKDIKRNRYKCVNSSSPDRSLPILLHVWPRIKEQVKEAELHIYYGFANWEKVAQHDQLQMNLINRLKQQMIDMKELGVVFHDRINQKELAEEFLSAGCLLYPTFFTETFFIGGAEAQAAGLRVVSSSIAAINETVGGRGILVDGVWTDQGYQDRFVEAAFQCLTKEDDSDRLASQQYAQEHFGLNELAKEWQDMFYRLIEEVKENPVVLYKKAA